MGLRIFNVFNQWGNWYDIPYDNTARFHIDFTNFYTITLTGVDVTRNESVILVSANMENTNNSLFSARSRAIADGFSYSGDAFCNWIAIGYV